MKKKLKFGYKIFLSDHSLSLLGFEATSCQNYKRISQVIGQGAKGIRTRLAKGFGGEKERVRKASKRFGNRQETGITVH